MPLNDVEARVLASLIEKEAAVPESYPLTLNSLRLACNQSTNRRPVVAYDDRTVESALVALKSVGLVRFVHPSHGGRTTRYRHTADERWRLSAGELLVLSSLTLRGLQTANEVRVRVERMLPASEGSSIEQLLDTLAARSPEPLAVRVALRPGERDERWASLLGGGAVDGNGDDTGPLDVVDPVWRDDAPVAPRSASDEDGVAGRLDQLTSTVAALTARLERLEQELGVSSSA